MRLFIAVLLCGLAAAVSVTGAGASATADTAAGRAYATTHGSAVAGDSKPIHGKVIGHFASASSCFGCGEMVKYVRADRVWCAWQGDNVIVHVRFRNTSVEHITISWHPSYTIRGGGSHGEGFSSM